MIPLKLDKFGNPVLTQSEQEQILRLANIIYFRKQVWDNTDWMGIKTAKCPMDMWVYQELLYKLRPDYMIETGTLNGGSALFFAQMFDIIGHGEVISVDIEQRDCLPDHDRITYVTGSSTSFDTVQAVQKQIKGAETVMVILDSDHKHLHKLKELKTYGKMVTPGSYMIAEDSCFDEYPAWPEYGPGPAHAIRDFMAENKFFEIDRELERHMITFAPKGFLKKVR